MSRLPQRRTIGRTLSAVTLLSLAVLSAAPGAQEAPAQPDAPAEGVPQIPEEPKTIDPATLVPEKLAAAATADFAESSLREIADWIEKERGIPVLFDNQALSEAGIPLGEPVSDRLKNEPVYLLLNRLQSLGLAWYVDDNIVHVTTAEVAAERMATEPYNLADLLDAGFSADDLLQVVIQATAGPWEELDGTGGGAEWLGDVLFVRHTDAVRREAKGLLAALRKHGTQTFALDPPQHDLLRRKLDENVSVRFVDVPLSGAVRQLAEQTGVDLRLDMPALRADRIREREPVSLTLADRKLSTVLQVLLADLKLTWILRDGVLWITTADRAEEHLKTAVYDVRDLCRDENESEELASAIQTQTSGPWQSIDGTGGIIIFARPGAMVVQQTERVLAEVRDLLARYRQALVASKPRKRDAVDPQEVITRYYRMHETIAEGLAEVLPRLVSPETWKDQRQPDAPGTVLKVSSEPELRDAQGRIVHATADVKPETSAFVLPRAVLIIRQKREVHDEIAKVIRRVEQGDAPEGEDAFGSGMGGFGGGYFSVPRKARR